MLNRNPNRSTLKREQRSGAGPHNVVSLPLQWVWHYAALLSLRGRLTQKREQRVEATGKEPVQMVAREFDLDLALSLLTDERDPLGEVDAALRRILEGSYGIAEASGEPISAVRLEVAPWSRHNFAKATPSAPLPVPSDSNAAPSKS